MSAWMLTYSGRDHFLSGCEILTNQVDIADVAHSLAQINRYTGHATRPYCVAEHSLLVADLARRDGKSAVIQLACLLHDAHESATGDASSPAKQAIGLSWHAFEARQADIFRRRFGLLTTFQTYRKLIGHYDLVALATERRDITTYDAKRNRPWAILDTPGAEIPPASPSAVNLNTLARIKLTWRDWRDLFLEQYHDLSRLVHAAAPTALAQPETSMSLTEFDSGSGAALAETPADAAVDAHMTHAALDLLVPSPTNPRKTFDQGKLAELADSIRAAGLMSPILVRPLSGQLLEDSAFATLRGQELLDTWEHKPKKLPRPAYEIVAGERRWRASILAQLRTVPIVVRPLTDAQVLEAQLVENLQRDDLHPLEEAEGYQRLVDATSIRKEDIAGKIGKSRSYVYQRLQLLDLAPESREAFRAGKVDASKAQLLATVADPKLQLKALKEFSADVSYGRTKSVRECRDWLQQNVLLKIKDAPFDTKDELLLADNKDPQLDGARACATCPKRTNADRDLFAAFDGPDMCIDARCYHAKEEAHLDRIRADAAAKGMEVIAGKEAKKLKPYSYGSEIKGYTRLDTKIDGEPVSKLVGKDVKPVLFVDPHTQQKVKVLPTDQVEKTLKKKGLITSTQGEKAKRAKADEERQEREQAIEEDYQGRALAAVHDALRTGGVSAFSAAVLRMHLAWLIGERGGYRSNDLDESLLKAWGLPVPVKKESWQTAQAMRDAVVAHVNAAPDGALGVMLLQFLVADELTDGDYRRDSSWPLLHQVASECGIDLAQLRKDVQAEHKAAAKAAKQPEPPPGAKLQAAPQGSKAENEGAAAPKKGRAAARAARTSVDEAKQGIADAMQNMGEPGEGAQEAPFTVGMQVRVRTTVAKCKAKWKGEQGELREIVDGVHRVAFGGKGKPVGFDAADLERTENGEQLADDKPWTPAPTAPWPFPLEGDK